MRAPSLDRRRVAHRRAVATAALATGAIVAAVGSGHVARPSPPNAPHPPLGDSWSGQAFGLALAGTLALESVVAAARPAAPADTWLERAPRAAVDRRWRRGPAAHAARAPARRRPGRALGAGRRRRRLSRVGAAARVLPRRARRPPRRRRAAGRAGVALGAPRPRPGPAAGRGAARHGRASTPARSRCAGRAIAFLGGSGAGKTTLASRIVARGARLVTDDVLAIEVTGAAVQAHRGGTVARIDPRELRGADALRAPRPGRGAGARREVARHARPCARATAARPHLSPGPPAPTSAASASCPCARMTPRCCSAAPSCRTSRRPSACGASSSPAPPSRAASRSTRSARAPTRHPPTSPMPCCGHAEIALDERAA